MSLLQYFSKIPALSAKHDLKSKSKPANQKEDSSERTVHDLDETLAPKQSLKCNTKLVDTRKHDTKREKINEELLDSACDSAMAVDDSEEFESLNQLDDTGRTEVALKPKKKTYKQKFRGSWKDQFTFVEEKNGKIYCTACNQQLQGSKFHIERHAMTPKHKKTLTLVKQTIKVNEFIKHQLPTDLEHKMVMFGVEHNLSFNAFDHLTLLMKDALKAGESQLKNLKLNRTKATGIVTKKFAPDQQHSLVKKILSNNKKISIILDESTDVSAIKSLAVTIKFFEQRVKSRFLCLIEVPQADAQTLFEAVMTKFEELGIPFHQIIGYGADNANVMMGKKKGLLAKFKEVNPHIFAMGCVCHSLDLCSSAAASKLPNSVEQFVHDVYDHFAHSAKRKFIFQKCQDFCEVVTHMLLRPCDTRWLSLKSAVDRILEQWIALTKYFNEVEEGDKSLTTQNIIHALEQPVFKLYLCFLSYTLDIVCKMNVEFQSEQVKIHQLHDRMTSFYLTLLKNYLKRTYVSSVSIGLINPKHVSHYLSLDDLYVGPQSEALILSGKISINDIKSFKTRALDYYVELCLQIRKRYDFDSPILANICLIDPVKIYNSDKLLSIMPLAIHFPNLYTDLSQLDTEFRLLQDFREVQDLNKSNIELFWHKVSKIQTGNNDFIFTHISNFAESILCLPHSSAEVERVFSKINNIKTKVRNKLKTSTVEALLLAKDFLKENGGKCYAFHLPNKSTTNRSTNQTKEVEEENNKSDEEEISNALLEWVS